MQTHVNSRHTRAGFLILLWCLPVLITVSCGQSDSNVSTDAVAKDSVQKDLNQRVPVEVTTVDTGPITASLQLSSTIETEAAVDVYPLTSGIIRKLHTEEGRAVQEGAILISLDAERERLAEAKARVQYEKLQSDYQRKQKMFTDHLISEEEIQNTRYGMEEAKLSWMTAKTELEFTEVKAPISGIIAVRLCNVGDRIQQSSKLFSIVDLRQKIIRLNVPQKDVGKLDSRLPVLVTSDFLPEDRYQGFIKRMSPVIDSESGTLLVTVGLRGDDSALRPGMFVNCQIVLDTHKDAVLLPKDAIVYENGLPFAFTVSDTIAFKRRLTLGYSDSRYFEILQGVQAEDRVITIGQNGLRDRSAVRIVPADSSIFSNL